MNSRFFLRLFLILICFIIAFTIQTGFKRDFYYKGTDDPNNFTKYSCKVNFSYGFPLSFYQFNYENNDCPAGILWKIESENLFSFDKVNLMLVIIDTLFLAVIIFLLVEIPWQIYSYFMKDQFIFWKFMVSLIVNIAWYGVYILMVFARIGFGDMEPSTLELQATQNFLYKVYPPVLIEVFVVNLMNFIAHSQYLPNYNSLYKFTQAILPIFVGTIYLYLLIMSMTNIVNKAFKNSNPNQIPNQ